MPGPNRRHEKTSPSRKEETSPILVHTTHNQRGFDFSDDSPTATNLALSPKSIRKILSSSAEPGIPNMKFSTVERGSKWEGAVLGVMQCS